MHGNMDAPDHKYPVLSFDFPRHLGREPAVTRINSARFQRAPEGSHHSTGRCGNNIVDFRCMGLGQHRGINFEVLGDGSMNTECYRMSFTRQMCNTHPPLYSFNAGL